MFTSRSEPQQFFVEKQMCLFWKKASFGVPKPCLLHFRLAAGVLFLLLKKRHAVLKKCVFWSRTDISRQYLTIFVKVCQYLSIFINAVLIHVPTKDGTDNKDIKSPIEKTRK